MHTRDDLVVNARRHVYADHWLHAGDGHDTVDLPYIIRACDVLVFDPVDVVVLCFRDIMIACTGDVVVSTDVSDLRHRLVLVDCTHVSRRLDDCSTSIRSRIVLELKAGLR